MKGDKDVTPPKHRKFRIVNTYPVKPGEFVSKTVKSIKPKKKMKV